MQKGPSLTAQRIHYAKRERERGHAEPGLIALYDIRVGPVYGSRMSYKATKPGSACLLSLVA